MHQSCCKSDPHFEWPATNRSFKNVEHVLVCNQRKSMTDTVRIRSEDSKNYGLRILTEILGMWCVSSKICCSAFVTRAEGI